MTIIRTLALSTVLIPGLASAANPVFSTLAENVVDATTVGYPEGAGSPSLVWDDASELFFLFFETQVQSAGCDEAWAIGLATSADGVTWDARDLQVQPAPGTSHACGARHPAALVAPDGTRYLYFNVVTETSDDQVAAMKVVNGRRATALIPDLTGLRELTVASWDGSFVAMGISSDPVAGPAIQTVRSTDGMTWTYDATDAIPAAATVWATDGHHSPALMCRDSATWEWELYYGGTKVDDIAWAFAASDDAAKWFVGLPIATWDFEDGWYSWDLLKVGTNLLAAYEDADVDGRPRVNIASTTDTWDGTIPTGRWCDNPSTP